MLANMLCHIIGCPIFSDISWIKKIIEQILVGSAVKIITVITANHEKTQYLPDTVPGAFIHYIHPRSPTQQGLSNSLHRKASQSFAIFLTSHGS